MKMPRKKKGESKEKNIRFKNGSYYFRYDVVNPTTGKRKQKEDGPHATEQAAINAGILINAEKIRGTYIEGSKKTISQCADEWLKYYIASGVEERTVESRKSGINLIKEKIGGLKISELSVMQYQEFLNGLKDEDYKRGTLIMYHSVMKMIFKKALEQDYVKKDITQFVKVPIYKQTVEDLENQDELPKYLEKNELAVLLKTAKEYKDEQIYRIIYILSTTGMRIGELLALMPSDIDEINKRISIKKTLYIKNSAKNYKLNTPKNKSSIRTIDVSQRVVDVFKEQMAWKNKFKMEYRKWFAEDSKLIFINNNTMLGHALNPVDVRSHFSEIIKIAKLPENITPHSLRHTYTSLMAESGVELPVIQQLLGHKNDKTTTGIYLHVTSSRKRAAVEKLDALMDSVK